MKRKEEGFQSVKAILAGGEGLKGSPLGMIDLVGAWPSIVGRTIAERSCPARLRHGTLTVHVPSPVWAQELQLMSELLLEKLAAHFPEMRIKKLRFYCG